MARGEREGEREEVGKEGGRGDREKEGKRKGGGREEARDGCREGRKEGECSELSHSKASVTLDELLIANYSCPHNRANNALKGHALQVFQLIQNAPGHQVQVGLGLLHSHHPFR